MEILCYYTSYLYKTVFLVFDREHRGLSFFYVKIRTAHQKFFLVYIGFYREMLLFCNNSTLFFLLVFLVFDRDTEYIIAI